ncbi:MAG: cell division protein ZapA [Burkholderiaceae bacterium]
MKQLEVHILGQSYLLACPEGGESQMLSAVEKVDAAMSRIRDAGKVKARDRIAVLAALNLAFETAPPTSAATTLAAPSATEKNTTPAVHNTSHDPRLLALLARIDHVLAHDDRLL